MQNIIDMTGLLLGLLSLFVFPSMLTKRVILYFNKRVKIKGKVTFKPLSLRQRIYSMAPLVQMVMLRKALYNSKAGFTLIMCLSIPLLAVFRLVVYFLFPNSVLWLVTAIGMLLALVLMHLLYAITIFDVSRMAQCSTFTRVLTFVVPYVTALFVYRKVPEVFNSYYEEKRLEGN